MECGRAVAKWNAPNRESLRETKRKYRAAKWRVANRQKILEYRRENKHRIAAKQAERYLTDKDKFKRMWRERALAGAAAALKERERDDRDDEIARLKSKVGEITMDNELLYAKIEALEGKRPLAHRRSRR